MSIEMRAADDVRLPLTPREADRLLRLAVAATEASPGWEPGEESCYEIKDTRCLIDGFERPEFSSLLCDRL